MIKRATAAVAVTAFGLALGASTSFAADQQIPCGAPAVPAVYETVVVPGTPAVTHTEYLWQHTTVPVEFLWQLKVIDKAAWIETVVVKEAWTETVVVKEAWTETIVDQEAWDEWVIDVQAQPEVTVTEVKWVAKGNNADQWLPIGETLPASDWNKTNTTRVRVVSPAIEEQGHWEHHDAVTHEVEHPAETTEVQHPAETTEVIHPEESHYESQWAVTSPGDGWVKTDESRELEPVVDEQWSSESPGDGWVKTDKSRVVTDQEAIPDTTKEALVTPATPAGEPCVEEPPVEQPPVEEPPVEQPPVEQPPVEEGPVAGPVKEPAPVKPEAKPTPKPASAVPQVGAVKAVTPTRLAYTGSDLTLLWTGLGLVVIGAGLGAGYRRVSREN